MPATLANNVDGPAKASRDRLQFVAIELEHFENSASLCIALEDEISFPKVAARSDLTIRLGLNQRRGPNAKI